MNEIKSKELVAILEKKGFVLKEGSNHELYYFFYNGKRTSVRTQISRGSKSTYSGSLLSRLMKQLHLDKTQFSEFIECSMSEEDYTKHLISIEKI